MIFFSKLICIFGSSADMVGYGPGELMNLISLFIYLFQYFLGYINGLVQKRRNSIANALELHLSCTNPAISTAWCNTAVSEKIDNADTAVLHQAIDICLVVIRIETL